MDVGKKDPQTLFSQPIRYEIPDFQRRYVWGEDHQWEPLWKDVEQLAQSIMEEDRADSHFMGAVVLQHRPSGTGTIQRRIVVDGQQRLTTLQLLIDAVQEILEKRGLSDPAMRLAALVANQKAFWDGDADNRFKVWPTVVDRAAFRHAMSNDLSATDYAASRIVQAHEYFRGQAEQWLDRFSDGAGKRDAADALDSAIQVKLELVVIDLGETDDPHVIFETLNARGTPLLQSDMIKNKVLHDANRLTEDEDTVPAGLWPFDQDEKDKWWQEDIGQGRERRPRVDVYLNHWLTLRNRSEMKAHDEFRAFAEYVKTRMTTAGDTIHNIVKDMTETSRIYRDVEQVRLRDIAKFLERRNVMNVGAVTPFLLWLLSSNVPPATLANCLKALESFLVRRVVCGYGAKSYGELFANLIKELDRNPTAEADTILPSFLADQTAQGTLWPDDEELLQRFVTAPLYKWLTRGRLRMVLTGIEEQLRIDHQAETKEVSSNLQIEHIMPQAWQVNWPLSGQQDADAEARRERAIQTIGNLTLLNGPLNLGASNYAWNTKREKLADHSVLFLNRYLVDEGPRIWNEDGIQERARWLHEIATKIWPRPDHIATT